MARKFLLSCWRVLLVFSRTFVMYARSFMKWNLLPVCWIPANVCRQTVPFKLYVSRHSNRGSWLNSIASHECLRGFRRKFVFRRMSTSFFFSTEKPSSLFASLPRFLYLNNIEVLKIKVIKNFIIFIFNLSCLICLLHKKNRIAMSSSGFAYDCEKINGFNL